MRAGAAASAATGPHRSGRRLAARDRPAPPRPAHRRRARRPPAGRGRRPAGPRRWSSRPSRAAQQRVRRGRARRPQAVVDAVLAALPGRGDRACARCSTPPACCCTPTSAGPRCPPPPAIGAGPRRRAPATSSSTWPPAAAAGAGAAALDALLAAVPGGRGRAPGQQRRRRRSRWSPPPWRRAAREIVIARGELVEIGDGFRIPDLLAATGARLREVGTTNRVRRADYAAAVGPDTAFVLKVHPSNFVVTGFTRSVGVDELPGLGVPVVADIGSGLLAPHPLLPDEPDAATHARPRGRPGHGLGRQAARRAAGRAAARRARRGRRARAAAPPAPARPGAAGGQAHPGRVRGHPARAGPAHPRPRSTPTRRPCAGRAGAAGRPARRGRRRRRSPSTSAATVGGGGAPGVTLPSAAVALPERFAAALRPAEPAVLGRLERGRCLLDLRALPPADADRCDARRARPWRSLTVHVVATAGHVDHGKSTLVRALTGMEPDRWAEERRRGMTIDLGFAWTELLASRRAPSRSSTSPATSGSSPPCSPGSGPVPAVLLVVAADEGWMPQSRRAPRRARRARRPARAARRHPERPHGPRAGASTRPASTWPAPRSPAIAAVCVSAAHRGRARRAARRARPSWPPPCPARPSGRRAAVGRPRVHHPRRRHRGHRHARRPGASASTTSWSCSRADGAVRRSRCAACSASASRSPTARGVARVAVNLRGVAREAVARGDVLLTPGPGSTTDLVDVRLHGLRAAARDRRRRDLPGS